MSDDKSASGCTLTMQYGRRFRVENHQFGGECWKNTGVRDGLTWRDKFGWGRADGCAGRIVRFTRRVVLTQRINGGWGGYFNVKQFPFPDSRRPF